MKNRKNYKVIAYYGHIFDNTESYCMIINAESEKEIEDYFNNSDLDYIIVNKMDCNNLEDIIENATGILIDGIQVYKDDKELWDNTVELLNLNYGYDE